MLHANHESHLTPRSSQAAQHQAEQCPKESRSTPSDAANVNPVLAEQTRHRGLIIIPLNAASTRSMVYRLLGSCASVTAHGEDVDWPAAAPSLGACSLQELESIPSQWLESLP